MLRDLEILNIDYSAANPEYRRTETHAIGDLNGRVLIPFEGPMFGRNLVVRADGTPLTIEKDYELEDDFDELEMMTGKKVIGSLRFSRAVLNDYKEVKISYQKVGEVIISRDFLLRSADTILNNTKPIDWLTQVFGKPDTFPPGSHIHDVREESELVGFKDLLLIFKQASGQTQMHGLDLWNRLKVIEEKAFATLNSNYKEVWDKMFSHIMNVNLPHPMTKAELGLGNHPNYATATREEDQKAAFYGWDEMINGEYALRNDVISTPNGVALAIDNYQVDTDGFIRQGSLPFSYYGSGFYLPPPIKGSFEGLGSDIGTAALCLESNGIMTALIRGYDSKVKSLYYYTNANIYDRSVPFKFTGVKYSHPLIESDNAALLQQYIAANGTSVGFIPLEANHVISGSSGLILAIGDYEKNKYYIGLGNGTLDPNSHVLKRINVADFDDKVEGNTFDPYHSCIMLIGDYVYFVAQCMRWPVNTPESEKFGTKDPNYRLRMFYRADKSALIDPNTDTITFKKQLMNYWDLEGKFHSNQSTVEFVPTVIGTAANGEPYCKTMWMDFEVPDPTFTDIKLSPYHCNWLFKENPNNKNIASLRMLHGIQYWYYGVRTVGENMHAAVPMTFDTTTNTISIDKSWFKIKFNIETGDRTTPANKEFNSWYHGYISPFVGNFDEITVAWVDRVGVVSIGTRIHGLPFNPFFWYSGNYDDKGAGDQWEYFNRDFSTGEWLNNGIPMESPFGFASVPSLMVDVWNYNGAVQSTPIETFRSYNDNSQTDMYYRVSDDVEYIKRDDLRFPYVNKDIYARNPNSRFGTVKVEGYNGRVGNLPAINYPYKDAKSAQYGFTRIYNVFNDGTHPYYYNELYALSANKDFTGFMDSNGGFYMDTLGSHTLDNEAGTLTISPDKTGRVWITKDFWRGLLRSLLGDDDAIATANGLEGTGEYLMSFFLAHKASGKNIPVSMAMVFYHKISADPLVAKVSYMKACTFEWTNSGNNSEGFAIPKITSIKNITHEQEVNNTYENMGRKSDGRWNTGWGVQHGFPTVQPSVQITGTDSNNMEVWFSCGVQASTVGSSNTPAFIYRVKAGVEAFSPLWNGIYTLGATSNTYQALHNGGLQQVVAGTVSGGGAFYSDRGDGTYSLVEAVFVKGNWTLFISNDLTVLFNGSSKVLKARNYSLDQLGIDPANKVFYLYAVCGKTEGYYDLSLSERTASPYHMLVATITTISTGIKTIEVNQVFAISGFGINTSNKGGSVPATTGTFPENGVFEAIVKEDLFDSSKYQ